VPATELEQFQQWWPSGHVNQKRNDAVEMLRLMRACLAENLPPKRVSYSFEYTSMWETARRLAGDLFNAGAEHDILELEWLLNELRLKGTSYDRNKLLAVERYLAIRESYRLGVHVTEHVRDQTASLFREDRNLTDDKHLSRWKQENRLSDSEFDSLISDEARLRWFHRRARYLSFCYLAEQLRVSGDYAHLSRRALTKQHVLESFGLTNPSLSDTGLTDSELMQWYFEKVLYRSVPQNIRKYSQELDFANPDAFHRAVIKEYLFRQLSTNAQRKESA
jgi:hypothetical protein